MVLNRKKPSKLSIKPKKSKKVPNKVRLPIIVDCDENLVPLVLDMVGMLSEQTTKINKKPIGQSRRHKPPKRFMRSPIQDAGQPEEQQEPQEPQGTYGTYGAGGISRLNVPKIRRGTLRYFPRRRSLLSSEFVRIAATLVEQSPVQARIAKSTLLTPSPSPLSLPSKSPSNKSAAKSAAEYAAEWAAESSQSESVLSQMKLNVGDADKDEASSSKSQVRRFGWVPKIDSSSTGPALGPSSSRFSIPEADNTQASSNSQLLLAEKPQSTPLTFTPRESAINLALNDDKNMETSNENNPSQ